jgi:hypothetical protein
MEAKRHGYDENPKQETRPKTVTPPQSPLIVLEPSKNAARDRRRATGGFDDGWRE